MIDRSNLSEYLSIIVITSPSPSNPCTNLIQSTIHSLQYIHHLEHCHIYIIFDGYKVSSENRTKKGKITKESEVLYKMYIDSLINIYSTSTRYHFIECNEHYGFAHAVKLGLESCKTKYAIISQHDRMFVSPFTSKFNNFMSIIQ